MEDCSCLRVTDSQYSLQVVRCNYCECCSPEVRFSTYFQVDIYQILYHWSTMVGIIQCRHRCAYFLPQFVNLSDSGYLCKIQAIRSALSIGIATYLSTLLFSVWHTGLPPSMKRAKMHAILKQPNHNHNDSTRGQEMADTHSC